MMIYKVYYKTWKEGGKDDKKVEESWMIKMRDKQEWKFALFDRCDK